MVISLNRFNPHLPQLPNRLQVLKPTIPKARKTVLKLFIERKKNPSPNVSGL
jgi:hypothetical protein